jgi:hypothetical protein
MRHDVWAAIMVGLTASVMPTVGIVIVWLQQRAQFDGFNRRFASIDERFDEMIIVWREELRGFEDRMVARLKRREESR